MKIILVKDCDGCWYHTHVTKSPYNPEAICDHRSLDTRKYLRDYPKIPDWCPLDEYEPRQESNG